MWNRLGMMDPVGMVGSKGRVRAPDVVHAPSVAVPPRGRVPLVVTVHDAAPLRFPDTYPRRGRRFHAHGFAAAALRADAIVAPTAAAADEVAEFTAIARERIRPIHHGVDHTVATDEEVARTRDELGVGDRPYVCWAGTLEPRKDVGVLVDAFARAVAADDLPHRLVLAGPSGWLAGQAAVAERAAALGDRVLLVGAVEPGQLRALYRGADVFALPSKHEGFGLPVLEALAQGTTVLASDLPVLREVAGDAARFAPVGDVEAWAVSLGSLLGDPDGRERLGVAGVARAATFTWERCAREHLEVYRSVV
jgi:glycosyltransferase involved in cell wall biosynthesis